MGIGLNNTKLDAGQSVQRLGLQSRSTKVAPSIAEQAIFIPKPHKRVDFKLDTGAPTGTRDSAKQPPPLPGSGSSSPPVSLPGDNNAKANVADSVTAGKLGDNGVTARMGKAEWGGGPSSAPRVKMEVNNDPTKEKGGSDPIPTQEEGRQVNHKQVNFTQQYDAYGRPRIGFSREPYDFAATKYVSVTSQVAFQQNMAQVHQSYDQYLLTNKESNPAAQMSSEKAKDTPAQSAASTAEAQATNATGDTAGAAANAGTANAGTTNATSGDSGDKSGAENTGQDKAVDQTAPKVMGQEKIDDLSKPKVLGDQKNSADNANATGDNKNAADSVPVLGDGSKKTDGAQDGKKGVTAEESFEKQQAGASGKDNESSEKGIGTGAKDGVSGTSGKATSAYQSSGGSDQPKLKLSLSA